MGTLLDTSQDRSMATHAPRGSGGTALSIEGPVGLAVGADCGVGRCFMAGGGAQLCRQGGTV